MTLPFRTTPFVTPSPWVVRRRVPTGRAPLPADLRPAFHATHAAEAQLDRLLDGDALCVTTGQQPGLLLGPLFTIYKALSAIALAEVLGERLDRPVVPVFWVAGDDHDFAEANHVFATDLSNEVTELRLRERAATAPLTPLYREPLGPDIDAILDRLRELTPETEFRPSILEWVARHYRPKQDFATAFADALAELLGPHGLVVFRPTHERAKHAMAPLLLEALRRTSALNEALTERARSLESARQAVPVPVGDTASLVMMEGKLGRDRLMVVDGGFESRRAQETWSMQSLETIARDEPMRLSPNVLLRPVVEAALLPTLAYVAGPGELAYFPQCEPLYDALDVVPQATVPRWSAMALETRVSKVLRKYDLEPDDLRDEGRAESRLAREDMPADAADALSHLRGHLGEEYGRLERAAGAIDPTLKKPIASARNAALASVNDVEKRIVAHLKKGNDIVVQQIAKARHNLFPHGHPQERVFNVTPYLIRYGSGFIDAALDECRRWTRTLESTIRET